MKEKLRPRGDYLYVRPFVQKFDGRIAEAPKYKQALTYGEVLAKGSKVQPDIAIGSRVYYSNWAGVRFQKDKPDSIIQLKDSDIISIGDDENGIEIDIGEIGFVRER